MEKILVAVDLSEHSFRTVEYVGRAMGECKDVRIELFSIIPEVSRQLVGDKQAKRAEAVFEERPEIAGRYWRTRDEEKTRAFFDKCIARLEELGVNPKHVGTSFRPHKGDIATAILEEAERRGFGTVAMGRRGLGLVKEFFLGSVSKKVVSEAHGVTVWVVV